MSMRLFTWTRKRVGRKCLLSVLWWMRNCLFMLCPKGFRSLYILRSSNLFVLCFVSGWNCLSVLIFEIRVSLLCWILLIWEVGYFFFKFLFYMVLFYSFFLFGLEMTILEMIMLRECWGKVEKMIQNRFRWFEFVERRVDSVVRRIDPIERSEEEDLENL